MTMIRMTHPDHGAMHAYDKGEIEKLQSHGWSVDPADLEKTKIDGPFPSEIQAKIEAKRLGREKRLALEGPTVPAAPRHFEQVQAKVATDQREKERQAARDADAKALADKIAKGDVKAQDVSKEIAALIPREPVVKPPEEPQAVKAQEVKPAPVKAPVVKAKRGRPAKKKA